MDQEPQDAPPPADDVGKPKFFQNINGVIAGITGLVIALGGLAATWDRMFKPKEEQQEIVAGAEQSNAEAAPEATEAEAADEEAGTPSAYTYNADNGGTLKWANGLWIEADANGNVLGRYDPTDDDGVNTTAKLPGGGENGEDVYLRWPNAGGQAQKSEDRQAHWEDAYWLTPEPVAP